MRSGEAQKAGIDRSEVFDRLRSHWLSNVAHDLSGALFAARGYLRMVLEEPNGTLPEPQRRYLIASLENVNRLVALTQELNDFPGKDWFELDTVALHDLLREAISEVRAAALKANIQVNAKIESGLLNTIGDAGKLAVAVKAFLANALDFTGPGGTVQVVARKENDKIMVEFNARRLSGKTPDKPSSDLSLACKILRLHGGVVFIDTASKTPGEGHLIIFELPVIRLGEC